MSRLLEQYNNHIKKDLKSKLGLKNDIYYFKIKIKFLDSENHFKKIIESNLTN